MKEVIKLFIIAPIISGLLVLGFDSYLIANAPYQIAIFEEIRVRSYWLYVSAFVTGFMVTTLANIVPYVIGRKQ